MIDKDDAIHAFLDCVRVIGDDVHECKLCLERYYGARCYNEVRSPLSLTFSCRLFTGWQRSFNAANHAHPGEITVEIHDIFNGMTQTEEMDASQPRPALLRHAGKHKWATLSLPPQMDSRRSCLCKQDRFWLSQTLLPVTRFLNNQNVEAFGRGR